MNTILWGVFIGATVGAMYSKQRKVVISSWFVVVFALGTIIGSAYEQGKNRRVMDEIKVTRAEDVKRGIELSLIEQLKKVSQVERFVEDHPGFGIAHARASSALDWIEQDDMGRELEAEWLLKQIREKKPEQSSSLDTRWTKKLIIQLFNENPRSISTFQQLMNLSDEDLESVRVRRRELMQGTIEDFGEAMLGPDSSELDSLENVEFLHKLNALLLLENAFSPNLPHMPE